MARFKVGQLVRLAHTVNLGRVMEVSTAKVGSSFLYDVQWLGSPYTYALYRESELDPFENAGVIA